MATADTVENLPALHSPHELAPCSMPVFVIEPASHSSHDVLPALREYLPARQSLHASTADAEYWPAAHAVHVVAPVVLPVFVIQPASHSAHVFRTTEIVPTYSSKGTRSLRRGHAGCM